MNEDEAFYEDSKWDEEVLHEAGEFRNGRPYLGRWEPDRYPDEPKKQATQTQRDAAAEEARLRSKIQRDAIFFAVSIDPKPHQKVGGHSQGSGAVSYLQARPPCAASREVRMLSESVLSRNTVGKKACRLS